MAERRFKIVSAGWKCAEWWERTLRSIEAQSVDNWDVRIRYDGGDDAGALIQQWCDDRDDRWQCTVNDHQLFAVQNQVEAIRQLDPADDDIIVFLDLDGDQLASPDTLALVASHYDAGALVTYGSYEPVPSTGPYQQAEPFPEEVVRLGRYREHILNVGCCFNHLRTISGRVFRAIPDDQFRWPSGPKAGQWYRAGTDYIFMTAALELAGGRYACVPETTLLYNNANPNADNRAHPDESAACTQNYLRRLRLAPLDDNERWWSTEPTTVHTTLSGQPGSDPYLSPEQRRAILRDYGRRYKLRVFVETGTANGDTPAALMHDFDRLYTIEVSRDLYAAARQRFDGTNVTCLRGDSGKRLCEVLAAEVGVGPILFWLDGHFSGGARADKDTPILEELDAIFADGCQHVILVDDARLFEGMSHFGEHDWPHIDEVRKRAEANNYDCAITDDIVRLTPK